MNYAKRLCGKRGNAQVYKGEAFLAFGNLQQAVPVLLRRRSGLLGDYILTALVRIAVCSTVSEDGPMEVDLGAPLGGIPLQIFA